MLKAKNIDVGGDTNQPAYMHRAIVFRRDLEKENTQGIKLWDIPVGIRHNELKIELENLFVGITARELMPRVEKLGAKTCYFPRTRNYRRRGKLLFPSLQKNKKTLCLANENFSIKIVDIKTKTCHRCQSDEHLVTNCPRTERDNKFKEKNVERPPPEEVKERVKQHLQQWTGKDKVVLDNMNNFWMKNFEPKTTILEQIYDLVLRGITCDEIWEHIRMCNNKLQARYIPEEWSKGNIVLIPKPKDREGQLEITRPITLMETMCKFFTIIINTRLAKKTKFLILTTMLGCRETYFIPNTYSEQHHGRGQGKKKKHQQQHQQEDYVIFNLSQHRCQRASENATDVETICYQKYLWNTHPSNKRSTKIQHKIPLYNLLAEFLIKECTKNYSLELSNIPSDYLKLIISIKDDVGKNNEKWNELITWFSKKNQVPKHIEKGKLQKVLKQKCDKLYENGSFKIKLTKLQKDNLIKSTRQIDGLVKNIRCFINSGYIVNQNNQTSIHLENVNNSNALLQVTKAVNEYYFHLVDKNNEIHRTSILSALTMQNHQICVNNLLCNLVPLSNNINKFIQENYGNVYMKLKQLSWNPFVLKFFGIFSIIVIAINFNTISDYHWDENNTPNCLYCLVSLGDFRDGELYFSQLHTLVPLQPDNFHNIMDIDDAELIKTLYDNKNLNTKKTKLTKIQDFQQRYQILILIKIEIKFRLKL
ncbi:hypothetical protein Glove_606g131 [Diversispora epigaea]|uniref:Uncharacterized protein n=1 Tax=Diversispora epigaea TaxID=1348612 RepID=A0A397G777_9GLOM|nr:hypothetical protein Glove_606g131 [Diversispora epigaea]